MLKWQRQTLKFKSTQFFHVHLKCKAMLNFVGFLLVVLTQSMTPCNFLVIFGFASIKSFYSIQLCELWTIRCIKLDLIYHLSFIIYVYCSYHVKYPIHIMKKEVPPLIILSISPFMHMKSCNIYSTWYFAGITKCITC